MRGFVRWSEEANRDGSAVFGGGSCGVSAGFWGVGAAWSAAQCGVEWECGAGDACGTNLTFVGIALDSYTNAPAGTQVEVVREGVVSLPFTGAPPSNWLGALLYWNGSAYTFTATGNTAVGRVIGVEGNVARVVIQTVV
jgi:predicted RecA/RadA family phage recombinase